ncbi:MAG TPA: DegT/DnrJ/EryC1/StrS family aminotransferase [Vicinamibacterales bacterium]|nr:DegT/DnrJ/EryC1/StrS family aminotransferase [Vicinamibacterales bacterium]
MIKPIQLFVPTFRVDECLNEVRECLEKGWTGLGFKTLQFESEWCRHTGLPHAHFVNSATSGLHLAVRLLRERYGWSDGDEVISTPLTFVSSNHVILYERLRPVFADVDEYLCLDPASIEQRITPRTRAVIFVGLGGNTGRLAEVVRLCRDRGLQLILDAAHMSGTRVAGRHVGGEADVSVFSFHAVKNLPTADGGMICFPDADSDARARRWTWLGIDKDTFARTQSDSTYKWHYSVEHVGFKYHGNSIMAGIGRVSLRYLEEDNAYRRQLASWYDEGLADVAGVTSVPMAPECVPARHLYQVLVDHRDEVMVALNEAQIYPGVHYRDNSMYPMYADQPPCPRARRASERVISLPLHPQLTRDDVDRVCTALRNRVARPGRAG